jgi:hypothetical protein
VERPGHAADDSEEVGDDLNSQLLPAAAGFAKRTHSLITLFATETHVD